MLININFKITLSIYDKFLKEFVPSIIVIFFSFIACIMKSLTTLPLEKTPTSPKTCPKRTI